MNKEKHADNKCFKNTLDDDDDDGDQRFSILAVNFCFVPTFVFVAGSFRKSNNNRVVTRTANCRLSQNNAYTLNVHCIRSLTMTEKKG